MDCFQGITTEIISNDQALILYNDPDAGEVQESHVRHYYVEAMVGCTFQVKANLTPQFNLNRAQAVRIKVLIDDSIDSQIKRATTHIQNAFSRGKSSGHTFRLSKHFCNETGQWMSSEFSFGSLILGRLDLSMPNGYRD